MLGLDEEKKTCVIFDIVSFFFFLKKKISEEIPFRERVRSERVRSESVRSERVRSESASRLFNVSQVSVFPLNRPPVSYFSPPCAEVERRDLELHLHLYLQLS